MTNALVEIGLILASVALGVFGFPIWVIILMLVISFTWWGFVHRVRLGGLLETSLWRGLGSAVIALGAVGLGHSVGYGLGRVFHGILGLT